MAERYIMGIDAGTMGVRCAIFDLKGGIAGEDYHEMPVIYPKPGWVEQDAQVLVDLAFQAVRGALAKSGVDAAEIASIGFTGQRTTFAPIDRDGSFLTNMFLWQDTRGAEIFPWAREQLKKHGMTEEELYARTGHVLGSCQCGTKAFWFRLNMPEVYERTWKLVTPHSMLTHAFGADGWFDDMSDSNWWLTTHGDSFALDPELVRVFGMREDIYPEAAMPGTCIGRVTKAVAEKTGLKAGTPLFAGCGDQQCAHLGAGNYGTEEMGTVNLGTAGVAMAYSATPIRDPNRMCNLLGHPAGGYTFEGYALAAASSFRWIRNAICQEQRAEAEKSGGSVYDIMTALAAQSPAGSNGTVFLPWLMGAACPHYNDEARGAFVGMSLGTGKGDLIRAAMEGICFEMREVLDTLQQSGVKPFECLRAVGGACRSELWNEIQANVYNCPVEAVDVTEATSMGAALTGAVGAGVFASMQEATEAMIHVRRRYEPTAEKAAIYDELFQIFQSCYRGLAAEAYPRIYAYQNR